MFTTYIIAEVAQRRKTYLSYTAIATMEYSGTAADPAEILNTATDNSSLGCC
jgi:hypothetical protein